MYERPLSDLKYMVIHHTVTSEKTSNEDIRQMHLAKGYSDIGYHYLIRESGASTGRDIHYNGAHALGEKVEWIPNQEAIGIALVGDLRVYIPKIHDKLINELVYLVNILSNKYHIPVTPINVVGHHYVDNTECPGFRTMFKFRQKWLRVNEKKGK